jgi:FkbM family methyltransferase
MGSLFTMLHRALPPGLRQWLKARGVARWLRRFDPRYQASSEWELDGVLAGHRLRIHRPEEYQFVARAYEPAICTLIQRLVQPGWVCADVGAHIGYMSLLLCKLTGPDGHVYAFEALPENAALLTDNLARNGYSERATAVHAAITDGGAPTLTLYLGVSSFEASCAPRAQAPVVEVPALALDTYFAPGARVDLVKMDIEGAEALALPGMARLLRDARPVVVLELHEGGVPALDCLHGAGYRFEDVAGQTVTRETARTLTHCVAWPPSE